MDLARINELGRELADHESARGDEPRRWLEFQAGGQPFRVAAMRGPDNLFFVATARIPAPRGASTGIEIAAGLGGGCSSAACAVQMLALRVREAADGTARAASALEALS